MRMPRSSLVARARKLGRASVATFDLVAEQQRQELRVRQRFGPSQRQSFGHDVEHPAELTRRNNAVLAKRSDGMTSVSSPHAADEALPALAPRVRASR